MRVLGPALITKLQQDKLIDGATLNVARVAIYDSAARRAKLGDRFWVREPYVEITPRQFGAPQSLHAICHGHSPTRVSIPANVLRYAPAIKFAIRDGSDLNRAQSRASLEIAQIMADGMLFRCIVHMGNVDVERSVAA